MTSAGFTARVGAGSTTGLETAQHGAVGPGKRTLVEQIQMYAPEGQRKPGAQATQDPTTVARAAEVATSGTPGALPYRERIQAAFGRHDVSRIQAFIGGPAAEGAEQMGAQAFANGEKIAFRAAPDLRTAAHEAAHVVQQRGGVQLAGGVGKAGDSYEQHADAVADRVVQGGSAEALLDTPGGGAGAAAATAVQRLVIPIGDLPTSGMTFEEQTDTRVIATSAKRLEQHGEHVEHLDTGRKPLAALGKTEELTILAHGGSPLLSEVADTYGGHSPTALAALLVANGLKTSYAGTIYLNGCNTATKSERKKSYAERFQAALFVTHKIAAAVRGNEGGSRVMENGQTGFRKQDRESLEQARELELELSKLQGLLHDLTNIQFFSAYPQELIKEENGLQSLGLDERASNEQILDALRTLTEVKGKKVQESAAKIDFGKHSDALYEARPDLIKTLPRPATDNEILLRLAGLLALVSVVAAQMPSPFKWILMMLGVVVAMAITARALLQRPH